MLQGINLITSLWTEGERHIQLDHRFYEKSVDGATKNDHFRLMLATAKERGFVPQCVVFDSWYSSLDNLKLIRGYGWLWLTQLKRNRHVILTTPAMYHRGLKQCCGVERAQVRSSCAQRNHVGLAIRAFLRLELYWFATGISIHSESGRLLPESEVIAQQFQQASYRCLIMTTRRLSGSTRASNNEIQGNPISGCGDG